MNICTNRQGNLLCKGNIYIYACMYLNIVHYLHAVQRQRLELFHSLWPKGLSAFPWYLVVLPLIGRGLRYVRPGTLKRPFCSSVAFLVLRKRKKRERENQWNLVPRWVYATSLSYAKYFEFYTLILILHSPKESLIDST